MTFAEIKNAVAEDSPSISYHLNTMAQLILQDGGRYGLSELGKASYGLIRKTAASAESNFILNRLRRELRVAIIANALIWATALFLASQF